MMTLNLWRAEWLKARKRPANRIMLLFINLLAVLFVSGLVIYCKASGKLGDASSILPFPKSLDIAINTVAGFSKLLTIVFVANAIGSEYSQDTWKMILPRYGSRSAFLVTKVFSGLVGMVVLFLSSTILWVSLSWLGAQIVGVESTISPASELVTTSLKTCVLTMFEMIFYGSLTFLATIATRSVIGGVIGGLVGLTVLQIAGALPLKTLIKMLPTTHLVNVSGHWLQSRPELAMMQALFGDQFNPQLSLAIVLAYILFLLGISLLIFQRRDIAGQ